MPFIMRSLLDWDMDLSDGEKQEKKRDALDFRLEVDLL